MKHEFPKLMTNAEQIKEEHECGKDDEVCEECCEHDDMDDFYCCNCGKDCTEDIMARAYDRAKDFAKYGE